MDNIIEELKQNEFTVFVGWGKATQAKAREIGVSNFHRMDMDGAWKQAQFFYPNDVYVLRPDYTEPEAEAGMEKCKVKIKKVYGYLYIDYPSIGSVSGEYSLSVVCDRPDFIGYLYEDGEISPMARLYKKREGVYCSHLSEGALMGYYEVLTPTHVLFREVGK